MKIITAIVLDGFHRGHTLRMEYYPILKLLKPKTVTIDYCCDPTMEISEKANIVEYKECFRATDQEVVLFSESGKSMDLLNVFPIHQVSKYPWTQETTLYFGYHNEPILRTDKENEKKLN